MSAADLPRYCPERPLPPYSYVSGLFPHPLRDERGHSFGRHEAPGVPLEEANARSHPTHRYALDLFNHGYYWEAHEAWEGLWLAAGRVGMAAELLQGLIKLAAAGVKAREGRAAGVRRHAARAAERFRGVAAAEARLRHVLFGLELQALIAAADSIARRAESLAGDGRPDATRRLEVVLPLVPDESVFSPPGGD